MLYIMTGNKPGKTVILRLIKAALKVDSLWSGNPDPEFVELATALKPFKRYGRG